MDILLEENPISEGSMGNPRRGWFGDPRGHRAAARKGWRTQGGFNPIGFDEFGNPITMEGFSYNPNIRRRLGVARRRRRYTHNPLALGGVKQWTQGIELTEVAAAVGGLAASTMIPPMLVATAETTTQKLLRIVASVGCAIGVGFLAKQAISPSAGKAAIAGGLAGSGLQALRMVGVPIGQGSPRLLPAGRGPSRLGAQQVVSPSLTREGETVQILTP